MTFSKTLFAFVTVIYITSVNGQRIPPWPPKPGRNERVIEENSYCGSEWSVFRKGRWKNIITHVGHVNPKGKWLGLYEVGNGKYALKPCQVTADYWHAPEFLTRRISVSLSPKPNGKPPHFAVKAGLSSGEVTTVCTQVNAPDGLRYLVNGKQTQTLPDKHSIKPSRIHGRIRQHWRQVRESQDRKPWQTDSCSGISWRKQILESWRYNDEGEPIWMGDLDGDGKLDLYIGVEGHGGYEERHLFLSSWAEPDEIVGRVGGYADSSLP